MARLPMVTRSFTSMTVNAFCIKLSEKECFNKDVRLPRVYNDNNKLFKVVKEIVEADTDVKLVQIVGSKTEEKLIGMTEEDFLMYGVELDKETRKPVAIPVEG